MPTPLSTLIYDALNDWEPLDQALKSTALIFSRTHISLRRVSYIAHTT